ncbi:ribosome recycling factor [Candidatus Fermentibacterales bacterium]|nr:ribosome recycling factor [Candidatus Fermentibacterales bacterium]
MIDELLADIGERMSKTVKNTSHELAVIRTGKASPALLDNIRVECWGEVLPLKQVAGISAPEPRLLVVQPWDQSTAEAVARSIDKSDLGLRANLDGPIIRIPIPKLSEERRKELTRHVRKLAEEGRTGVRNLRREANDSLKKACKEGTISEDREKRALDEVQKLHDSAIAEIDAILASKESEITEV